MSPSPVSLLDLKPEEFKTFLYSFDHVFSDCDGVLWNSDPLPRVGEFFELMKKLGKTVHFVSNNSIRTQENYENMFNAVKIENGCENLITPSVAISEYLKATKTVKKVYSVSCAETTKMLESYGYVCTTGPDVAVDFFENHSKYFEDDLEIGAVVFDSDFGINLAKLHKAITYLKRPEVLFLCGATDGRVYFENGIVSLGCAIFTDLAAIETNRKPVVLGKPSKIFGEFAMKRAGVTSDPSRILFIGDMIDQDVALGRATGFKTLMVLSNIRKETMLNHETRPDYYANSLASIVPLLQAEFRTNLINLI